jgi:hypothetical protein
MSGFRRPHGSRVLLALAFCLALLAPGGAGRAAAAADLPASLAARAAAGLEQGLLRDGASGSLVAAGSKRDHRQRPGPALLGVLVAAVVAAAPAWAVHARRRSDRPGHRRCAAAAGPRAPPPPQPAPI